MTAGFTIRFTKIIVRLRVSWLVIGSGECKIWISFRWFFCVCSNFFYVLSINDSLSVVNSARGEENVAKKLLNSIDLVIKRNIVPQQYSCFLLRIALAARVLSWALRRRKKLAVADQPVRVDSSANYFMCRSPVNRKLIMEKVFYEKTLLISVADVNGMLAD